MDLRTVRRVAELLSRLSGRKQEVAVLPMRVQKAPFPAGPEDALPRACARRLKPIHRKAVIAYEQRIPQAQ